MRRFLIAIALSLITSCHLSQTPSDNVAVTSPFDGKIRKINYESQNNNYILATATLDTTEATTMSEFIPRMPEIVAQISYGKF